MQVYVERPLTIRERLSLLRALGLVLRAAWQQRRELAVVDRLRVAWLLLDFRGLLRVMLRGRTRAPAELK